MRPLLALLGALALATATACGGATADRPPEVALGQDLCDRCNMIISEARFASAYVTADGAVRRFDDIGDMLLYHADQGEEVASFWVHDYRTGEWMRAESAYYVMSEDIQTPMGHGIVALSTREEAEALAGDAGGMVMTWEELLERRPSDGGMRHGGAGMR